MNQKIVNLSAIDQLMANAEKASKNGGKGGNMKEQLRTLAPLIIPRLLSGEDVPLDFCAEALGHKTNNWVGTLTGGARGGAGLHKTPSGAIRACRDNVLIMLRDHIPDRAAFLKILGLTEEQFVAEASELPKQ